MTLLDVSTVCEAITETFRSVPTLNTVQDLDEITDMIPKAQLPLLMVYEQQHALSIVSETQMTTFGGGMNRPVNIEELTINCDVYTGIIGSSPLQEVMESQRLVWAAVAGIVREQTIQPYFGTAQIKSFVANIERVTLRFSDQRYYGFQLQIVIQEF